MSCRQSFAPALVAWILAHYQAAVWTGQLWEMIPRVANLVWGSRRAFSRRCHFSWNFKIKEAFCFYKWCCTPYFSCSYLWAASLYWLLEFWASTIDSLFQTMVKSVFFNSLSAHLFPVHLLIIRFFLVPIFKHLSIFIWLSNIIIYGSSVFLRVLYQLLFGTIYSRMLT